MKSDINKILIYVIIGLAGFFLLSTVISLLTGKASLHNYRKSDPSQISQLSDKTEKMNAFKELGSIRALTKPEEDVATGVNLVVTPWFSYEESDSSFTEELSHKKQAFKTVILNYFASYTKKQLYSKGEKSVKYELLELINQNLVMGKIQAVYFDDYIFLD